MTSIQHKQLGSTNRKSKCVPGETLSNPNLCDSNQQTCTANGYLRITVSVTTLPMHGTESHDFAGCPRLALGAKQGLSFLGQETSTHTPTIFLAFAKLEPASKTTLPGVKLTVPVDADLRHGSSWLRQPESKGRRGERVSVTRSPRTTRWGLGERQSG